MRAEERRSHRLNVLANLWHKPNITETDLLNRAIKMGVTQQTARSYVNAILQRYPKK